MTDAPSLALRKLLRFLRTADGNLLRRDSAGGRHWRWNDATIEAGIRRGFLEPTEHGKRKGKHRPVAVRITEKGRAWRELAAVGRDGK